MRPIKSALVVVVAVIVVAVIALVGLLNMPSYRLAIVMSRNGATVALPFTPRAIEQAAASTLTLTP